MRKIKAKSILAASLIILVGLVLTFGTSWLTYLLWPDNSFRSITVILTALMSYFFWGILIYRLCFTFIFAVPEGHIPPNSHAEFNYEVSTLVMLFFYSPLSRSLPLPIFLTGVFFRWAGAKIGANSFSGGFISDPGMVSIGKNCLLGINSLIVPHELHRDVIYHKRVVIEDNATIGAMSIVMPGCHIKRGGVLGMCSLLPKGSVIGENEVWAGVPARLIRSAE